MPATHDPQTEPDETAGGDLLATLASPARDDDGAAAADPDDAAGPGGFGAWYRSRPLIGGIITALAGAAMFLSSQLDLGNLTIHVGVEGMQATILPIIVALAGVLAVLMPAHRIFYGVIALAASVYSLVAVNLGGFFVGFLLGCIGGIMVVSWAPRRDRTAEPVAAEGERAEPGAADPDTAATETEAEATSEAAA